MADADRRRWVPLGLAGLLGLCCISVPALLGGGILAGGAAGTTAVATGVAGLRGIAVTVLVTAGTLLVVAAVWRARRR